MASNKKKQDEKHLKILRDMVALPCNKQCFDCHQRGPTYVNMTIGSFVCTSCSGILRGLNPPHRVKSISMASFSPEELESLKSHSNELCRKVYLGLYDSRSWPEPDSKDEQRVKDFMVQKYENKRWYNAPTQEMKDEAKRMNEAAINKQSQTKPLRSLLGDKTPKLVLQNSHSTQANRQHPHPVSSAQGVIGTIPMPTSAAVSQPALVTANIPLKPPAQVSQPKSNVDFFGNFGSDPFGPSAPITAPVAPIPSSAPFPVAGPGSNANTPTGLSSITSSSTTTPTVSDKYSAFADLFSDPVPASTEASRPNDIWSSTSSAGPASTLGGGGGMSWGGGVADTNAGSMHWGGTSSTVANPFSSAATQSPMGLGQNTQIGMGQSPQMLNQPSQIGLGMGQTGQMGIGPMGMAPTSVANPFASGLADLSGKPAQPVAGTGFASWNNPPVQSSNNDFFGHNGNMAATGFGAPAQPASGFWPTDQSQGFGAPATSAGAWNQQQPVNPFMQAANTQPVAPKGNSSNPFL